VLVFAASCERGPEPSTTRGASTASPSPEISTTPKAATTTPPHDSPGRIEEHTFASRALGVEKRYLVYVPHPYASSERPYPVIVLLHGLGGNESDWVKGGDLLKVADGIGLRALVVTPDGDAGFYVDGAAKPDYDACLRDKPPFAPEEAPERYCVKSPRYATYITEDLLEDVAKRYRVIARREGRGIAGLSMGGFGALTIAMRHADVFAAAASTSGLVSLGYGGPRPYDGLSSVRTLSPSEWGAGYPGRIAEHVKAIMGTDPQMWNSHDPVALAASLPQGRLALRIDCGDQDDFGFHDHAKHLHDVLQERNIEHEFLMTRGRHDFRYWKARLPEMLAFFGRSLASP
jgi:S-formylglutathione hydrolase FrmB